MARKDVHLALLTLGHAQLLCPPMQDRMVQDVLRMAYGEGEGGP